MKNKKTIIILAVIVVVAVALIAFFAINRKSSYFTVENNEDGTISVSAQKAAENSGGVGYITIAKDQKLGVRSNLTDKSTIKIEVFPGETDATTKALMEESFTAIDSRLFEMPEGDYSIRITAEKGAEGTMDLYAE